jgi:hypothetical protein
MKKLLLTLSLIVLLSCEKLQYGNVIEREYHPEYTSTMLLPMVVSTGKTTTIIMIPYFVHHNESWSIDVKGTGVKGHTLTRTFYIDKLAFDTTKIGTFICVKGLCDEDTALHKTRQ